MSKVGTVTVPFCATLHFGIQLDCLLCTGFAEVNGFFGPITSKYIAGRPIQPLVVSISLQSFLKLLLSTCSKLEKSFTLCIAAIDAIIETVSTGVP